MCMVPKNILHFAYDEFRVVKCGWRENRFARVYNLEWEFYVGNCVVVESELQIESRMH